MAYHLLSKREREIAALVATGTSNKEIAYQLEISPKTVKNILVRVFDKKQTRLRTELAIRWIQSGYKTATDLPAYVRGNRIF